MNLPSSSSSLSNFVFIPLKWTPLLSLPPLPRRPPLPLPLPPGLPRPPWHKKIKNKKNSKWIDFTFLISSTLKIYVFNYLFIFTSAFGPVRFLLSFNYLLQDLFLFITLNQLPGYTIPLDLQFSAVCLCGFIKSFFCDAIKEKCALAETNKRHILNHVFFFFFKEI